MHNAFIEKHLMDLYAGLELSPKERKFVESKNGRSDMRVAISQELFRGDFEGRLDTSNLDIFPCNNGAFVTDAGGRPFFRQIQASDYLTKTSGWAYDPEEARAKRPEVDRFLEQVLPVPEERAVFLAYAASLLSGRRLAKRFLVFTDRRSGNNGKSMLAMLVAKFFGRLADSNGKKFVTRPAVERGGRNDHDAGTQGFTNVRVVIAEELKSNMLLDESMLKTLVSPMPMMKGRKFHVGGEFEYPWTAGFILVFNEDNIPKVDAADAAFWARVVVVPFRSKFVPADLVGDEPDTYPVDTHLVEKLNGWRSAFADVMCDAYDSEGTVLDTIPQSMREWKDDVKTTNNHVAEWMAQHIEFTQDHKDVAHRIVFDDGFVRVMMGRYREETEATLGHAEFAKLAKAYLKEGCCEWHVGSQKNVRIGTANGGTKTSKNVMVGIRLRQVVVDDAV